MAEVTLRYYAGMVDRVGAEEETVMAPATLAEVQEVIVARHGETIRPALAACSFLAEGRVLTDPETPLGGVELLEVLPPFAGG